MADWYVSSAAYATYSAFVGSHAYSIGDLIVPTAPAFTTKWVFQCTIAGTTTTEPAWTATNNGTSTSGTATFKNVTGQSSLFWTAAAGTILSIGTSRLLVGDRIFVSSDHSEAFTSGTGTYGANISSGSFGNVQLLCVNRAGSTPPVAADLTTGAAVSASGASTSINISALANCYIYGMSFTNTGTTSAAFFLLGTNSTSTKTVYMKNCAINAAMTAQTLAGANVILDNSTLQVTPFYIRSISGPFILTWINTPSAIAGTPPAELFQQTTTTTILPVLRGVDLSALTTIILKGSVTGARVYLDSCKIASVVTRYSAGTNFDEVVLINCYDGTNIISERHTTTGDVTTEFTIYLTGGAQDNVGSFSHKMITTANVEKYVYPLCGFWMDVNFTDIGTSKTATVEIISSGSLNNDEIALYVEYQGTAGSSVTSFADSYIATVLTPAAAVTSSSAAWNASPATPVKQKLQVTFTAQQAGRLRGQVRLGKASTTVYVNPIMTIS